LRCRAVAAIDMHKNFIGGRDLDAGAVSVRRHRKGNLGAKAVAVVDIMAAIKVVPLVA